MATKVLSKRVQISRDAAVQVAVIAVASFITVFCLIASKALLGQRAYQSKVIAAKEVAKKQLVANLAAVDQLKAQHKVFVESTVNVLDGDPNGTGDRDGDNDKLVLDALPSKYDFPALATSVEKILTGPNFKDVTIAGTDDEVAQDANQSSISPQPVEIPFQAGVTAVYPILQGFIGTIEKSIRPIVVKTVSFDTQEDGSIKLTITATTYYQPTKSLEITTKEIK